MNIQEVPITISEDEFEKWNVNPELLSNYYTETQESVKEMLRRCIQNSIFLKMRYKEITLTDNYIQSRCTPYCTGDIQTTDQYGELSIKCPKVNLEFCLITQEQKAIQKENKKLKEVFKPYEVPVRFESTTLEKVKSSVKTKIENYLNNLHIYFSTGKGITISGNIGSGKTSILYLIIKSLLGFNKTVFYVTSGDVMKYLIRDNTEYIAYLYHTDYLLIDDLGREYQKEEGFGGRQLDELIDYRYREGKITSLTTNLILKGAGSLEDNYPRIYDRLNELNTPIVLVGESQRKGDWK